MVRESALSLVLVAACLPSSYFDIHATFPTDTGSSSDDTAGSSSTSDGDSSSTSGGESGSGSSSSAGSSDSTTSDITASSSTSGSGTTSGSESVCGNGIIEPPEEECDGGERCFECTRDRWIYVSALEHSVGELDGIEGSDSRCRQYSLQSGKADDTWTHFIAWMSDSEHDMVERLPGTIRGRFVLTDGTVAAESVDELFSGMLAAPINLDEHGKLTESSVFTGTRPDGTAAPGTHCENWTVGSALDDSAYIGFSELTDGNWTMYKDPDSCVFSHRLYCVEAK